MKINPEELNLIGSKFSTKREGIQELIESIHKAPKLREWVTLESIALPPIPHKKGDNWHVTTLLTILADSEDNVTFLNPPWGLIEWVLPQKTITKIEDLRWNELIPSIDSNQPIKATPADPNIILTKEFERDRKKLLFKLLDKLINETFDLSHLAPHYSGLLPKDIYPYYWTLIPECKSWLDPNVPALLLPEENIQLNDENNNQKTHDSAIFLPPDLRACL